MLCAEKGREGRRGDTQHSTNQCCIAGSKPRPSSALFRTYKACSNVFWASESGSLSLDRAYCLCLARTAKKSALRSWSLAINTELIITSRAFDAITCQELTTRNTAVDGLGKTVDSKAIYSV